MHNITGENARMMIRNNKWRKPTAGLAPGYTQANLVILPEEYAFDFLLFCIRNPKPCPLLDICEKGDFSPARIAANSDIRTDIPSYRIYENGKLRTETKDIKEFWNKELVSFLLGCSFTFENALIKAGIGVRHLEEEKNVPMYITELECVPAGIFNGPVVVSMRPVAEELVNKAIEVTAKYPKVHGAPIHVGDPKAIGIKDIGRPDFGDAVTIKKGEVPVFWACGVTPQAAIMRVKPSFVITHSPGHMFIADIKDEELSNND